MVSVISPLANNVPIVDEKGNPTAYFARLLDAWLKEKAAAEAAALTLANLGGDPGADRLIRWNDTSNTFEFITLSQAIDLVGSAAQGDILYRNGTVWTRLAAGTSGHYLKTNGAGANPAWTAVATGGGYEAGPATPPTLADLATWDNQGTSTATDGTSMMVIKPQQDNVIHGRFKTAPATPYDVYCRVEPIILSSNSVAVGYSAAAGILFKDTGGDNERVTFVTVQQHAAGGGDDNKLYWVGIQRWSGASPPVFSATAVIKYNNAPLNWLRVNNNGTTFTFYASSDGKNWLTIGTETLAAYIDAAASYGVVIHSDAPSTESAGMFSYFSTTAPA